MIEIIGEIKDVPTKPDITPELAISAYNVIRQYCENQKACEDCAFAETACSKCFICTPGYWPDIEPGAI